MTAIVWANLVLAIPFLVAFIAVPLRMTFRTSRAGPDHADAHAYLQARTAAVAAAFGPRGGTPAGDRAREAARQAAAA